MADSVRQKIVDAVKTRFQSITVANGYETNLGNKVFVWRDTGAAPFEESELPAVVLFDAKDEIVQQLSRIQHHKLLMVADVVTDDATQSTQIRKLVADIYKAIGVDIYWTVESVRLAFDTDPMQDEFDVRQEERVIASARVQFTIQYRTLSWNPYTQN